MQSEVINLFPQTDFPFKFKIDDLDIGIRKEFFQIDDKAYLKTWGGKDFFHWFFKCFSCDKSPYTVTTEEI